MKTWRIDADRDDPRTRAIALGGGSERKNAALLRAMPAYAQTMTGGVAKRLVPRRPALLLALLASASNQTLLAALTVGITPDCCPRLRQRHVSRERLRPSPMS